MFLEPKWYESGDQPGCGKRERWFSSHPGGMQGQSHQEENVGCQKTLQVYNMLIGSIKNAWR